MDFLPKAPHSLQQQHINFWKALKKSKPHLMDDKEFLDFVAADQVFEVIIEHLNSKVT
jgi:hypothetical protein